MDAETLLKNVADPTAWRRQSKVMRRSADALWERFEIALLSSTKGRVLNDESFDEAIAYMQGAKLLYGLALETALKAEIVELVPSSIELKFFVNGSFEAHGVRVKNLGVKNGHDLEALAEKAGIFGKKFSAILVDEPAARAFRAICAHLTEMVVWEGRYPAPMASKVPVVWNADAPIRLQNHYMRDLLDPILDELGI